MIAEITTIAISTVAIAFFQGWCSRMSDETAYDDKARDDWDTLRASIIEAVFIPSRFTKYHIGHPNDAWHWFRRAERYGGYVTTLVSGAIIGLGWWLAVMVACHTIGGFVGFQLGSKWQQSIWLQDLAEWWHSKL